MYYEQMWRDIEDKLKDIDSDLLTIENGNSYKSTEDEFEDMKYHLRKLKCLVKKETDGTHSDQESDNSHESAW